MSYEILDHTADTGIAARATSLEYLVQDLATGMFALMAVVDPCPPGRLVTVDVSAPTWEDLVVEVLSELLYEAEVEDLILCGFRSKLETPHRIRVSAGGVPTSEVDLTGPPIKAVTYHDVTVRRDAGGWIGRIYFDV